MTLRSYYSNDSDSCEATADSRSGLEKDLCLGEAKGMDIKMNIYEKVKETAMQSGMWQADFINTQDLMFYPEIWDNALVLYQICPGRFV